MQSTFPDIAEAKDYILSAVLLVIATILLISRNNGGITNLRRASITVFSYLEEPLSQLQVYRQALKTNNELRKQNIILLDKLNQMRSARQTNDKLREMLNFSRGTDLRLHAVQITGKELNQINRVLTVSAGASDGIKEGMPMISPDGLIGQVVMSSAHYSQVMPLYNTLFRVSAKLQHSNAYGIIRWTGDDNSTLELQYVPQTVKVDTGEVVLTSGYSNKFPPNIPIGKVVKHTPNKGKDTQHIIITPFVKLYSVSAGFIVTNKQDSSLKSLNKNYQQSFK